MQDHPTTTRRYTQSQILCGLHNLFLDTGIADDPFDGNTRIYTYLKDAGSWEDLDLLDIVRTFEHFFGFKCSEEEWAELFGFDDPKQTFADWEQNHAQHLTFKGLAQFIADRLPVAPTFDPIFMVGRECAPAGIFLGIRKLANHITGKRSRFPPSARIIDVLQGNDLEVFWSQLRWRSENAIPELSAFWRDTMSDAFCVTVLAVIGAVIAWYTSYTVWIIPILLIAAVVLVRAWAVRRFVNPIPTVLTTFRDLSLMIADHSPTITTGKTRL